MKTNKHKINYKLWAVVTVVIGLWILYGIYDLTHDDNKSIVSSNDVCKASHEIIRSGIKTSGPYDDALKSPASAQFLDCSYYVTNFVGLNNQLKYDKNSEIGVYMISGPIDSQNGFGALIRNYYCAAMFKTTDEWQMWQFNIDEKPYTNCTYWTLNK